jgi:hypothetical protein
MENVDFIAVKIGDVNQSLSNINHSQTGNRSDQIKSYSVMIAMENWDNRHFLTFRASEFIELDGLQIFTTLVDAASKVSSQDVKVEDKNLFDKEIFIDESHIRFLQYSAKTGNFFKGDLIHAFEIDKPIDIFDIKPDLNRKSEIFSVGQSIPVSLQIGSGITTTKPRVRLQTNPVISNLNLIIEGNINGQDISYRITNISGQEISSSSLVVNVDHSTDYSIPLPDHTAPGIYFLHLKSDLMDETIRFISIR